MQILLRSALLVSMLVLTALAAAADQSSSYPQNWPWRGVTMRFPASQPKDLQHYHDQLGINAVSLLLDPRAFAKSKQISGEQSLEESLLWADSMLDKCRALHVTAVVDVSHFPLDPAAPDQKSLEFWSRGESTQVVLAVARKLAAHLKDRGNEFGAYQIMSEPVLLNAGRAVEPEEWPRLQESIVKAIRAEDPKRWIVVHPAPWGLPKGYRNFEMPKAEHLILGVHMYVPHDFTHQGIQGYARGTKYPGWIGVSPFDRHTLEDALAPLRAFQLKHRAPVWVGEFSAVRWANGGERYLIDLADIFRGYGWGWAYLGSGEWHGWNPDYSDQYGDNKAAVMQMVGDSSRRWQTLRSMFRPK